MWLSHGIFLLLRLLAETCSQGVFIRKPIYWPGDISANRYNFFNAFIWENKSYNSFWLTVNPIQDGLFRGCSRMGGGFFWPPLPKIRFTYPTMMKLGTVIPYLRKIQKMYKSRDTSLEFCWHQHFFTGNQQILLHQKIHI